MKKLLILVFLGLLVTAVSALTVYQGIPKVYNGHTIRAYNITCGNIFSTKYAFVRVDSGPLTLIHLNNTINVTPSSRLTFTDLRCRSTVKLSYIVLTPPTKARTEDVHEGTAAFSVEATEPTSTASAANNCPSSEELEKKAVSCKEAGYGYEFYEKEGCKYVLCKQLSVCPSEEELNKQVMKCKDAGLDYKYYYDENKCTQVTCSQSTVYSCPNEKEINEKVAKCKDQGLDYTYKKDDKGCSQVACSKTSFCPEKEELEKQAMECKNKGYSYKEYYDNNCKYIECYKEQPTSCPSSEELEKQALTCKSKGYDYTTYADALGCKYVKCGELKPDEPVQCKKIVDEKGCVNVYCTDGYNFNSCVQDQICKEKRPECKVYKEGNCIYKVCTDGYEAKECKEEKKVECKAYKDEKTGCEIKECSDGYKAKYCPTPSPECKVYKDDNGCAVKECNDGYKAKECPTEKKDKEVECKVYKDESGCLRKTCTNGFVSDSCEQQKVKCEVSKDNEGCEVKKCSDGYVARNCPSKVEKEVECKVIEEGPCTIKVCTDGYAAKECQSTATEKEVQKAKNILDKIIEIIKDKKFGDAATSTA